MEKEDKQKLITKFKRHDTDTGSPEVQIAIISERINYLIDHLKKHKKDHDSRRGLLTLVSQRKKLMNYLERKDQSRHTSIVSSLGMK